MFQCNAPRPPRPQGQRHRAARQWLREVPPGVVIVSGTGSASAPSPPFRSPGGARSTALGKRAMITIVKSKMNSKAPGELGHDHGDERVFARTAELQPQCPPLRSAHRTTSSRPDEYHRHPPYETPRSGGRIRLGPRAVPAGRSSNIFLTMLRYREFPCSMLTLISSSASLRLLIVLASCSWVARLEFS